MPPRRKSRSSSPRRSPRRSKGSRSPRRVLKRRSSGKARRAAVRRSPKRRTYKGTRVYGMTNQERELATLADANPPGVLETSTLLTRRTAAGASDPQTLSVEQQAKLHELDENIRSLLSKMNGRSSSNLDLTGIDSVDYVTPDTFESAVKARRRMIRELNRDLAILPDIRPLDDELPDAATLERPPHSAPFSDTDVEEELDEMSQ